MLRLVDTCFAVRIYFVSSLLVTPTSLLRMDLIFFFFVCHFDRLSGRLWGVLLPPPPFRKRGALWLLWLLFVMCSVSSSRFIFRGKSIKKTTKTHTLLPNTQTHTPLHPPIRPVAHTAEAVCATTVPAEAKPLFEVGLNSRASCNGGCWRRR